VGVFVGACGAACVGIGVLGKNGSAMKNVEVLK